MESCATMLGPWARALLLARSRYVTTTSRWCLGLLLLVLAIVYAPVAAQLARDWWNDPNYSHGLLIPIISGFLLWRHRRELAATPLRPSNLAFLGVAVSASLLVVGVAGAEVFTQRISLLLALVSVDLLVGGGIWLRRTAFPLGFLLLAIPMPYLLYYGLTGPLQSFAARCAVLGLRWTGVPAVSQGNIIHLPGASMEVAEACSGIRSLYAFLALGALLARSMSIPVWARILVFLSTIPLSVAANALRVWGTGIGAHTIGPVATEGTVHEFFGLVTFAGAIIIFLLVRKGARILWPSAS